MLGLCFEFCFTDIDCCIIKGIIIPPCSISPVISMKRRCQRESSFSHGGKEEEGKKQLPPTLTGTDFSLLLKVQTSCSCRLALACEAGGGGHCGNSRHRGSERSNHGGADNAGVWKPGAAQHGSSH